MKKQIKKLIEWQLLVVHPELRGTGIAWKIYRRMEQIAKEFGATKMISRSAAYGAREGEEKTFIDKFTVNIGASIVNEKDDVFKDIPILQPITDQILRRSDVFPGIKIIKNLNKVETNINYIPDGFIEEVDHYLKQEEINNPNIESWVLRWKQKDTNYSAKTWFLLVKGGEA